MHVPGHFIRDTVTLRNVPVTLVPRNRSSRTATPGSRFLDVVSVGVPGTPLPNGRGTGKPAIAREKKHKNRVNGPPAPFVYLVPKTASQTMIANETASSDRQERAAADSRIADAVSALVARGDRIAAGERFEEIVERHQRRAARIAYYYLRDPAEVDEAVQDAFLKAFLNIQSFRERPFFELWLTRILVNTCLDRLKSRRRHDRWIVSADDDIRDGRHREGLAGRPAQGLSPEATLLDAERRAELLAAVDRLPARQRAVVILSQFEGHPTRDVAAMLELTEATVRVHFFRAIRSLRRILGAEH